jgi:hypothetical protein
MSKILTLNIGELVLTQKRSPYTKLFIISRCFAVDECEMSNPVQQLISSYSLLLPTNLGHDFPRSDSVRPFPGTSNRAVIVRFRAACAKSG